MTDEWLALAEASRRLGISIKTARRRVKAGHLPGELRLGPHGQQYYVPASAIAAAQVVEASAVAPVATLAPALDMATLVTTLDRMASELQALRVEVAELRVQVAGQQTTAPAPPPAASEPTQDVTVGEASPAPLAPVRRPWWQFWRWGAAHAD